MPGTEGLEANESHDDAAQTSEAPNLEARAVDWNHIHLEIPSVHIHQRSGKEALANGKHQAVNCCPEFDHHILRAGRNVQC